MMWDIKFNVVSGGGWCGRYRGTHREVFGRCKKTVFEKTVICGPVVRAAWLRFHLPNGASFLQLLLKNVDQVMSGHGAFTSQREQPLARFVTIMAQLLQNACQLVENCPRNMHVKVPCHYLLYLVLPILTLWKRGEFLKLKSDFYKKNPKIGISLTITGWDIFIKCIWVAKLTPLGAKLYICL